MDLLNQLEQTKTETLMFFELEDEELDKTYAEGKWTVRYILHHLADTETVQFKRIRRILSEPRLNSPRCLGVASPSRVQYDCARRGVGAKSQRRQNRAYNGNGRRGPEN